MKRIGFGLIAVASLTLLVTIVLQSVGFANASGPSEIADAVSAPLQFNYFTAPLGILGIGLVLLSWFNDWRRAASS